MSRRTPASDHFCPSHRPLPGRLCTAKLDRSVGSPCCDQPGLGLQMDFAASQRLQLTDPFIGLPSIGTLPLTSTFCWWKSEHAPTSRWHTSIGLEPTGRPWRRRKKNPARRSTWGACFMPRRVPWSSTLRCPGAGKLVRAFGYEAISDRDAVSTADPNVNPLTLLCVPPCGGDQAGGDRPHLLLYELPTRKQATRKTLQ
jgi:hypothetical protein